MQRAYYRPATYLIRKLKKKNNKKNILQFIRDNIKLGLVKRQVQYIDD